MLAIRRRSFPACAATDFAVGSKSVAAPPWEGRHVLFPPETGPDNQNMDEIQRALLATRPYGASPIEGMLYDTADYMWQSPNGPGQNDTMVKGGCRQSSSSF